MNIAMPSPSGKNRNGLYLSTTSHPTGKAIWGNSPPLPPGQLAMDSAAGLRRRVGRAMLAYDSAAGRRRRLALDEDPDLQQILEFICGKVAPEDQRKLGDMLCGRSATDDEPNAEPEAPESGGGDLMAQINNFLRSRLDASDYQRLEQMIRALGGNGEKTDAAKMANEANRRASDDDPSDYSGSDPSFPGAPQTGGGMMKNDRPPKQGALTGAMDAYTRAFPQTRNLKVAMDYRPERRAPWVTPKDDYERNFPHANVRHAF
jgi:hypothetical protein